MVSEKLKRAVIKRLGGKEYLVDISRYGANTGFSGFTYYSETCEFYRENKKEIILLAEELAEELGEDMLTMVSHFNCLKDMEITPYEVAKGLDGNGEMAEQIQNAMAWFALEEVARSIADKEVK